MKIRDRLKELMSESPKTNKEMCSALGISTRIISATISLNMDVFLRLNKGLVGLKNRDEHLAKDWRSHGLPLYKKMVNCLQDGHKSLQQLYNMLPYEKKVSIRASVNIYPELFMWLGHGYIGRKNRDEGLLERYAYKKKVKVVKEEAVTIAELIAVILADGPKTLEQIHQFLPDTPRKSISCKLSLNGGFVVESGVWRLNFDQIKKESSVYA